MCTSSTLIVVCNGVSSSLCSFCSHASLKTSEAPSRASVESIGTTDTPNSRSGIRYAIAWFEWQRFGQNGLFSCGTGVLANHAANSQSTTRLLVCSRAAPDGDCA
eukprot:174136-Amphidinium_carterae.1